MRNASNASHDVDADWVTVKEAAVLAGKSERQIYVWIERKMLAMIKDPRNRMLVPPKAVVRVSMAQHLGRPKGTPTRQ